jgi:hypothetical protein
MCVKCASFALNTLQNTSLFSFGLFAATQCLYVVSLFSPIHCRSDFPTSDSKDLNWHWGHVLIVRRIKLYQIAHFAVWSRPTRSVTYLGLMYLCSKKNKSPHISFQHRSEPKNNCFLWLLSYFPTVYKRLTCRQRAGRPYVRTFMKCHHNHN